MSKHSIIAILVIGIVALSIPFTIKLSQQQTQLKSRADEPCPTQQGQPGTKMYCNNTVLGYDQGCIVDNTYPDGTPKHYGNCRSSVNSACIGEVTCPAPASSTSTGSTESEAATCGPVILDGTDITQPHNTLEKQAHRAIIRMTHPATSGGALVKTWSTKYTLNYVGNQASQLGLPTSSQSIELGSPQSGNSQYDFPVDFTPPSAGIFDFYWRMKDANGNFFGGQCGVQITVFSATGTPGTGGGTACSGSAGNLSGVDRVWKCVAENDLGAPPIGCVGTSKDTNRICNSNSFCYACLAGTTATPVGTCGACGTNCLPAGCSDLQSCRSWTDSDAACRNKGTGHQNDRCLDTTCFAPQFKSGFGCTKCWGPSGSQICDIDTTACTDLNNPNYDPAKPVCETSGANRGKCTVGLASSPSPSPSPSVSPSPSASTAPVQFTKCAIISEDKLMVDGKNDCTEAANDAKKPPLLVKTYDADPTVFASYTFFDKSQGIKTIFYKFIGTTSNSQTFQKSITFIPNPSIATVACTQSSSDIGTNLTLTGSYFGISGNGTVKLGSQTAVIDNWDSNTNTIKAHIDQRVEGTNSVSLTTDDGRTATPRNCTINTTTVSFKAALQCRVAGNYTLSNVDLSVFEAIKAPSDGTKPSPIMQQKISFDKDGAPTNFSPKFEKSKKYELIIKAPGTLAKRVDFNTSSGGTITLNSGNAILLQQGDIAPTNAPDGVINAFDKSELIRQWSLTTDVAKTGDLNADNRINSIDYSCMTDNIKNNRSDDKYSFLP